MYTINTPRVEECICAVMARHTGSSEKALGKYFEEVHQHLAPLARDLEREINSLRASLEPEALGELLRLHGLVDRAALEDPEGFDGGNTKAAIQFLSERILTANMK